MASLKDDAYRGPRAAVIVVAAALAGLTLVAAGCGGSSGPKTSGASDDPNAYSACMRSHGVGNFPDPDSNNVFETQGIDKNSPTFKVAARACHSLAPTPPPPGQQAQDQAQMLAFAKCMRSHGVPKFPDPQVVNGAPQTPLTPGQIDPNSPIVKAAIAACRSKFVGKGAASEAQKLIQGLTHTPQQLNGGRGSQR
jgi:hypothetical protein